MRTSTLLVAARRVAPYLLCAIGLLVLVAGAVAFIGSPGYGYDYAAYDAAARRIASGQPLYLASTAEAYNAGRYEGLYLYAPPAAVLLVGPGCCRRSARSDRLADWWPDRGQARVVEVLD
jgi:hypothetical protein